MLPTDTRVFAHRSFRIFWLSRIAGNLAFQMQVVAVGWQVFSLTGDPLDLGLVGLIQFLPAILLMLVVGQVADRYDRRRVILWARLALAASIGALALASASGEVSRNLIFAIVFFIGAAQAFQMPTSQAIIPGLVPAALLPKAIAWSSIGFQGSSIFGP
ncbi:MAG: MFS transporter, partial [Burkholderiaceae bacterium]